MAGTPWLTAKESSSSPHPRPGCGPPRTASMPARHTNATDERCMNHPHRAREVPPSTGAAPSPWAPSVHSWVYLPKDAPSRPGPWHLPQVRAQALQALIHDVAGWARTVHTLIVVLLGLVGTIALVLAISGVAEGVLLLLLTSSGALAVIVWALWGLWLERSQWRVIGAIKRWHGASASGISASRQVAGPAVRQLWTGAILVRLLGALALSAGAGLVIARAAQMPVSYPRLAAAAYLAVAAVALIGAVSVLGATLATALTLVRPPSPRPVPAM